MSFTSWQDFLHMGGYALYVWLSYGLSLALLGVVMLLPSLRHRQLKRELARQQRRAARERHSHP